MHKQIARQLVSVVMKLKRFCRLVSKHSKKMHVTQTKSKTIGKFSRRFKYNYVPWVIVNDRHLPSSEANFTMALCEE